jgi:hypothetical protein
MLAKSISQLFLSPAPLGPARVRSSTPAVAEAMAWQAEFTENNIGRGFRDAKHTDYTDKIKEDA